MTCYAEVFKTYAITCPFPPGRASTTSLAAYSLYRMLVSRLTLRPSPATAVEALLETPFRRMRTARPSGHTFADPGKPLLGGAPETGTTDGGHTHETSDSTLRMGMVWIIPPTPRTRSPQHVTTRLRLLLREGVPYAVRALGLTPTPICGGAVERLPGDAQQGLTNRQAARKSDQAGLRWLLA